MSFVRTFARALAEKSAIFFCAAAPYCSTKCGESVMSICSAKRRYRRLLLRAQLRQLRPGLPGAYPAGRSRGQLCSSATGFSVSSGVCVSSGVKVNCGIFSSMVAFSFRSPAKRGGNYSVSSIKAYRCFGKSRFSRNTRRLTASGSVEYNSLAAHFACKREKGRFSRKRPTETKRNGLRRSGLSQCAALGLASLPFYDRQRRFVTAAADSIVSEFGGIMYD